MLGRLFFVVISSFGSALMIDIMLTSGIGVWVMFVLIINVLSVTVNIIPIIMEGLNGNNKTL